MNIFSVSFTTGLMNWAKNVARLFIYLSCFMFLLHTVKLKSYCILYMESEAIVFCDEETQQKVPAEVLEAVKQQHQVEINAYPGRYVIPQTGMEGANYWAKKDLIEYVNYYKSQPEF